MPPKFEALIDVDPLQELFEAFHAATGLAASIVSLDGRILVSAGWQRICTDFHRKQPESERLCMESDTRMNKELLEGSGKSIYQCPHGLMDAAVPILIDNHHMANLFSGQFLFEPPDPSTIAQFKERAARYGYDQDAYLAALSSAPVIPQKRMTHVLRYLKHFAEMVGEMGLNRIQLVAREQSLAEAHEALEEAKRQQAEEARWQTQALEGNPIPTFVIDNAFKVTHWNRACELLTAIPATAILGTDKHREAFFPEKRPTMADRIVGEMSHDDLAKRFGNTYKSSQLVEGGFEGEGFFPNLGRHGKWLFVTAAPLKDSAGNLAGAIETIQDITARRMAEHEVRASEARYRHLFESANDAILIIKNGIIVDCNREALKLVGLTRNEIIGMSPLDFSPEAQADGALSKEVILKKAEIAFQDVPQLFEWRIAKANQTLVDVEVSLTRFRIGDDPHGLAILREITERKEMMRVLEERQEELNEKTRYLERVNQALKASLDHREIEKRSVEEHLFMNLKRFVYPYLEELEKCRLDTDAKAYVSIINTHLQDLTAQLSKTLTAKYMDFTPTEIRVADFIREGKNSKEIANLLGLSPSSVQWHRKNIREKLGLTHKKVNLNTYLASLTQ